MEELVSAVDTLEKRLTALECVTVLERDIVSTLHSTKNDDTVADIEIVKQVVPSSEFTEVNLLQQENKKLKIEIQRLNYRINHLVKALNEEEAKNSNK
jgi:hypothetical protein